MGEIRPLIVECYDLALDTNPSLAGKLVVDFTIIGEPDIGTIVAEASLDSDDGMTDDADFSECVRETILSLELPPPPNGGGKISVRYPFIFSNSDDEPTHTVPSGSGGGTASDLKAAMEAAKLADWDTALALCQSVLDAEPDNAQAIMVCAITACNLADQSLAQSFIDQLSSNRQQMATQICLRNGVEIN